MKFKFKVGDTVTILDGSSIRGYAGAWTAGKNYYVGSIATVVDRFTDSFGNPAYKLDCASHQWFDERGLSRVFKFHSNNDLGWSVTCKIGTFANDFSIKKVIFNDPATIVLWSDGIKTVVKTQGDDKYSKEVGLAMCIAKRALGNEGNYNNVFKKWCEEEVHNL